MEIAEEKLRELYHEQGLTQVEIAERFDCAHTTIHKRMKEYGIERDRGGKPVEVECANCGKSKEVAASQYRSHDRFFCHQQCQGEFLRETGRSRGRNNSRWKTDIEVCCSNCTERFTVYPSRLKQKQRFFCDNDCRGEWQSNRFSGDNHPLHKPDRDGLYSGPWTRVRQAIRNRDQNTCQLCTRSDDEASRDLSVHHIIPVREFEIPEESYGRA